MIDPVFQLREALSRYIANEIDLRSLQEAVVPLLPYFAERQETESLARMAVEVDNIVVDLMNGEAGEEELRAFIQANPTLVWPHDRLAGPP